MVAGIVAFGALVAAVGGLALAYYDPSEVHTLAFKADRSLDARVPLHGDAFLKHRERARAAILKSLGQGPTTAISDDVTVVSRADVLGTSAKLERVTYSPPDGDSGVALVGYPEFVRGLVVALHQATDVGMKEPMGIAGEAELAYSNALLRAGDVVIAPDVFAAGERTLAGKRWLTSDF